MKELSIEEKTKRYDELKIIAQELEEDGCFDKLTLFDLFPELAESEDERMIKSMTRLVKAFYDCNFPTPEGFERKDMLAWLEKQGEKTEPIEDFDTEFERQISHLIASAINREHEYNKGYIKWAAQSLIEYAKHEIEKHGEQNPDDIDNKFR